MLATIFITSALQFYQVASQLLAPPSSDSNTTATHPPLDTTIITSSDPNKIPLIKDFYFPSHTTDDILSNYQTSTLVPVNTQHPPPTSTGTPTPFSPITPAYIIPTSYLSQISATWPYTTYGVGRKEGIEQWGLTDGEGRTVAIVKHDVRWFPRPLGTWEARGEEWKRTFVVPVRTGVM